MVLIFLLIVLLASLAGCDNYNQYELEVIMPHLPDHIKNHYRDIKFELKYPGPGNDNYRDLLPGSSVFIDSSFSVFPVVATPYIYSKEHIAFYPAGGIFPESGKNGILFLKWENGFAAEIIYSMVNNGYNIDSFNMGRLTNYLTERSFGNPWIFEEEDIMYALSFNMFNANFVKRKKSHSIVLQMPFEVSAKRWLLSNLSDSRIFEENNGTVILDDIPERNFFILSDTGKEFAQLFLDNMGWHAYFSNSQEILSGRW